MSCALTLNHSRAGRNPAGPGATRSAGFASLVSVVSPKGELLSFACAKESNQRKAHPDTAVLRTALRCSCRGALRNSRGRSLPAQTILAQKTPSALRFSAPPKGPEVKSSVTSHCNRHIKSALSPSLSPAGGREGRRCEALIFHSLSRLRERGRGEGVFDFAGDVAVAGDVLLGPVGGAEKRRVSGSCARGLSERSEFRSAPENRASQGSAKHHRIGSPFFCLLFFGEAKIK